MTTLARTLLDIAAVLPFHDLRRAIAQAEILHLFDLGAIEEVVSWHPRHPGRGPLASSLVDWSAPARTRSLLEDAFLELCDRHSLPSPVVNGEWGGMEIDAMFPDQRVAVELDGGRTHTGVIRREDDYAKRAALTAAGWTVLAYTYRQVTARAGAAALQTLRPVLLDRQAREARVRPPGP